jgi:nucleotide-binding universal stress UspA family protein
VIIMSKPIVVGYDGSPQAKDALRWASAESVERGLPLSVVVAAPFPVIDLVGGTDPYFDTNVAKSQEEYGEHLVAEGMELARSYGVTDVLGSLASEDAPRAILQAAEEASMVVTGSRGQGGFLGVLLGSVSRQVSAHAKCPAVIVRPTPDPDSRELLVGVDGSKAAIAALDFAFDMASRHGYDVRVIHTWDVPPVGTLTGVPRMNPPNTLAALQEEEMRTTSEVLAGHFGRYPDVKVTQEVLRGSPVKVLADASQHAAMVVIGSRGRGGFVGLLLGSVSHGVAHHARCTVAVVR